MSKVRNLRAKHIWQLLLLYFGGWLTMVAAECGVCQSNQAACVSEGSFYLCYGGTIPNTDTLYHCNPGFDCTGFAAICVQSHYTRPPSCPASSKCGICSAHRNYLFACLSRGTFRMCYGSTDPTGNIGYCPTNYVCDAQSDAICVPDSQASEITCNLDDNLVTTPTIITTTPTETTPTEPIEVTTTTPTTPTTPTSANTWCQLYNDIGVYTVKDPICLRYVYCSRVNGLLIGQDRQCPAGTYFNEDGRKCTVNKPPTCV